ncbi:glycosyltransferase family 2 protein [Dickeya oryzae]
MLNIVIPMAGAGSRFAKAGYADPKPLIKVHDTPMIRLVINNLAPNTNHRFIFIIQKEHDNKYGIANELRLWAPGCEVVTLNGLSEGAACTVLSAKEFINNDDPLMIANSDQYVDIDINNYLDALESGSLDGLIMTMTADDPKWSFVGFDEENLVSRVVEKEVISNEATVGIYNFKRGSDFVHAAEMMISNDERVNGEFYVAPAYNSLIKNGRKIGVYNIGEESNGMYGLGIPDDLNLFLSKDVSFRATKGISK